LAFKGKRRTSKNQYNCKNAPREATKCCSNVKKIKWQDLVEYNKAGVFLTEGGEKVGSDMMRNSRLLEVLMDSALKVEIDEEMVCGIEHHMNKQFTDALCTMLNHPRKCPHSHEIPKGECCTKN